MNKKNHIIYNPFPSKTETALPLLPSAVPQPKHTAIVQSQLYAAIAVSAYQGTLKPASCQ
jgi:hypothetical protein